MVQPYNTFRQYKVQKEGLRWRHQPRRFCSRGWVGGERRKYACSISCAHVVCFEDWRKYWFLVWNSCPRIQMDQSLIVCLTLSHPESITRLRRLVLRIHPSAGAGKYLSKRPNIVKSLKKHIICPYLIFVFFFTQANFLENKIYTKIYTVNCQFTQ